VVLEFETLTFEDMMSKNLCNTVADAARYLDKHYPGWATKIDTVRLDMTDYARCIMGQVIGDTQRAANFVWDTFRPEGRTDGQAFYEGKEAWIAEINKRLWPVEYKRPYDDSDIVVAVDAVKVSIGDVTVTLTQDKLKALIAQLQKFVV
jgi:hypothetical protein